MKKYRFETFGGIISHENPPMLAFVDQTFMKEEGFGNSPLWETSDQSISLLSAPTEVHLSITNKCPVKCGHCYMDSGKKDHDELTTEELKKALKKLSDIGVFHVALGGGEALVREDLFEIAEYAQAVGLIPNLTISGYGINKETVQKMNLFGQVNVSIDSPPDSDVRIRKKEIFEIADNALSLLINQSVPTGINTVLCKQNYQKLEQLFRYAEAKKVNEIEFLRLKPSGRGKALYEAEKMTHEQNKKLILLLSKLQRKYKIATKIDCSFIPMLLYHKPSLKYLQSMGVYGCEAWNVLIGAKSNGTVSGCSFLPPAQDLDIFSFHDNWQHNLLFQKYRNWHKYAPEPCANCSYLKICKGGCHAVSLFKHGSLYHPDPDCPFVVDWQK